MLPIQGGERLWTTGRPAADGLRRRGTSTSTIWNCWRCSGESRASDVIWGTGEWRSIWTTSLQVSRELCPIENLKEYLRRTEGEREGNTQLLRTTVPPLRPASKQTVRSWLTKVLDLAGIQAPGGSTRAASATWAAARAVPISTIMAAADWSCIKTMSRYYIRPLPQGAPVSEHMSVQRAVLGDV